MKFHYYLITFLYCAMIFWLSSMPAPIDAIPLAVRLGIPIPHLDKIVHAVVYGLLAAIVSLGLRRSGRNVSPKIQFHLPWIFASLYGLSDEIHQYFVPERNSDVADFLANTSGAILVQLVLCLLLWRIPPRSIFSRS